MQRFSGERLRAARVAAGLSRERVAVEVSRSAESVTSYEVGRVVPPTEVVARLADVLGVGAGDLFEGGRTVGVG